jgi:hypothetical protein
MVDTKALAVDGAGGVVVLEQDPTYPELKLYRKGSEAFAEKKGFDNYINEFKATKGIKFSLSGHRIEKTDEGMFYAMQAPYYRQVSTLFKLPGWDRLDVRQA